ncbi:hypothetical protein [Mesorhizobium sp. WSM2239]|uniref:Core-binding (CB) domain-containing protein n=2 Tax=unclassified Mesorhizobium TaxID=325217 RepID=A0AAU8D153_9HYPH
MVEQPIATGSPSMRIASARETIAEPDDVTTVTSSPRPHGKALTVSEFGNKCESLIKSKRTWEKKTAQDVRVVVETFVGILAEHGVSDASEIEQFHVGRLREHFDEIPARYGQSARMRQLSPRQLRDAASKLVDVAKQRNQPPPQIGLGVNTIRKHLGNLAEFFRYLRGQGYALRELTLEGLRS